MIESVLNSEEAKEYRSYHWYSYNWQTGKIGMIQMRAESLKSALDPEYGIGTSTFNVDQNGLGVYYLIRDIQPSANLAGRILACHAVNSGIVPDTSNFNIDILPDYLRALKTVNKRQQLRSQFTQIKVTDNELFTQFLEMAVLNFPNGMPEGTLRAAEQWAQTIAETGVLPAAIPFQFHRGMESRAEHLVYSLQTLEKIARSLWYESEATFTLRRLLGIPLE